MNILYEDSMPYAEHFLNGLGNAKSFSTGSLGEDDLRNIDVLLVRSTTKVNKTLLQKAKQLKYVATATAGSDHLDKTFLASIGLPWGSAAGCNAIAVAEYVLSCLKTERKSVETGRRVARGGCRGERRENEKSIQDGASRAEKWGV